METQEHHRIERPLASMNLGPKEFAKRFREDVILKEFGKNLMLAPVHRSRIALITSNASQKLDIIRLNLYKDPYYRKLPQHKIFDWGMEHFNKRMQSIQYIDTLHLEHPKSLLISKLVTDLDNIDYALDLINTNAAKAIAHMKGCLELLLIRGRLHKKFSYHQLILKQFKVALANFGQYEIAELIKEDARVNNIIDTSMDGQLVLEPMYRRQILNNYNMQFEEQVYRLKLKEETLQKKIDSSLRTFVRNNVIHDKVMDYYYNYNHMLRLKINYWAEKYEHTYDDVDNILNYKTMTLNALDKLFTEHREQLQFFKNAIAKIYEMEERERALLEAPPVIELPPPKKKKGKKNKRK